MVDTVVTVVVGGDGVVAVAAAFDDGVAIVLVGVVADDWVPVGGPVVVLGDGVVIVVGVDGVAVGGAVAVAGDGVVVVGDGVVVVVGVDWVAAGVAVAVVVVDGVIVVTVVVARVVVSAVFAVEITLIGPSSVFLTVFIIFFLSTSALAFFAHGLLGSEHNVMPTLVLNLQQFIQFISL